MKFPADAQLPRRLASRLQEAGHEAVHTLDLPLGNRTPDTTINELSISEGYIVITKDADFVNSFHLHRKPHRLLLIRMQTIVVQVEASDQSVETPKAVARRIISAVKP